MPSSSSETVKVRISAMPARLTSPSPIVERRLVKLSNQLLGLGAFPQAGIIVLPGALDPPALAWQAVGLADNQHGQLRFTVLGGIVVDVGEDFAQLAHFGPAEMVPEEAEDFGI